MMEENNLDFNWFLEIESVTIEELYQAFKARLEAELVEDFKRVLEERNSE